MWLFCVVRKDVVIVNFINISSKQNRKEDILCIKKLLVEIERHLYSLIILLVAIIENNNYCVIILSIYTIIVISIISIEIFITFQDN